RCCGSVCFFQAEDGIRAGHVTGVQTCALPIYPLAAFVLGDFSFASFFERTHSGKINLALAVRRKASIACAEWQTVSPSKSRDQRSEERRVGKECKTQRLTIN